MKRFLIISTITLLISACTDLDYVLYDRLPEDAYTPDPVLGMVPIYKPMQNMIDDNGNWWFAQELTADGVVCPVRGEHWLDGGKWKVLHNHTWDNNVETVNKMWSLFYGGIIESNKFIETWEDLADEEVVAISLAKAKIMRAYYYYLLIDNYGDVPYVTKFTGADPAPSKTAKATIFENIVKEIEDNIPLLPNTTPKTAVTKGMAYTLLAKLYLNHAIYTGSEDPSYWEKAEIACDSVIVSAKYSLENDALAPFVTNNENSPENIFTIPFDEDNYQGFRLHMRTLHYNSNQTFDMLAGPWNGFAVQEAHYNTYENGDKRKDGFLVGQQYTSAGQLLRDQAAENALLIFTPNIPHLEMSADNSSVIQIRMSGVRVVKFEVKKGAKENLSNDFPIFRFADVLLMKAEAMIRQGKNGDAYVNEIRNRAGLDDWSGVTLDQLLEERGREMFWEGHRRQDLIRFGKFNQAWWEKPASDASRRTFPIPQWAIDANPNLAK